MRRRFGLKTQREAKSFRNSSIVRVGVASYISPSRNEEFMAWKADVIAGYPVVDVKATGWFLYDQ